MRNYMKENGGGGASTIVVSVRGAAQTTASDAAGASSSGGRKLSERPQLQLQPQQQQQQQDLRQSAQQQDHKQPTQRLSSQDLDQIWRWNAAVPETIERCIHDIISEQARQRPQDVAVQSWDGSLAYEELEAMSDRLASHLRFLGVGSGTTVPLCFEKSLWAVVSLLAVMKTGAAFSLTDPSQPEARLQTIVEQTGAKLIVVSDVQTPLGAKIAPDCAIVSVSQKLLDSHLPLSLEPLPQVSWSSLMYVIFTSGSTGKPKGVAISHTNYTSGAIPRAAAVGYCETSRVFDFPSYAFDVSLDCMLCTLACGGRVCVPSDHGRLNDLSAAIRDSKANMVHMTPSVARVLDADIIPSLDVLGLGGEAVSPSDSAEWSKHANLVIAYGPSECTVGCTANNTLAVSTGIGRGVGATIWLADPENHNALVSVGEVGELLVEGPIVGMGYIGEPAKTAEVFIEDPKWLTAGHGSHTGRRGRLYKTGDLVRYEPNGSGSMEFVGRKDQQVKIRGQRVELTEVEYHLQSCLPPGTKVTAEVIKPENGSPALIAFLSESGGPRPDTDALFAEPSLELASALEVIDMAMGAIVPRYMVPAAFVTLSSMPSMVSGKTDRKKLREIGASMPRSKLVKTQDEQGLQQEPDTDTEKRLAHAWTNVLPGQPRIYKTSNFFSLGGDSLRAMKLVAAAREQGLTLSVASIFSCPKLSVMASKTTISSQALVDIPPFSLLPTAWDKTTARKDTAALCGVAPEHIEDVYPCTPLQEALMALSARFKEAYVAQRLVVVNDIDTAKRLFDAFDRVAQDSPILRTRIVQVPTHGLVQVIVKGHVQYTSGDDLDSYLVADRNTPMSLGDPLIRYAIIHDSTSDKVSFVLSMHHAVYDGWSIPLIVERVNAAFQDEQIPPRPADFRHFIKHLADKDSTKSEKYWRYQLGGASGLQFPHLPHKDYQTEANTLLRDEITFAAPPKNNATMATIIRGAWALVSSEYTDATDVVFGETLTGRNAPVLGAEAMEGPMITTVPIRIQVDGDATVDEYLQAIHQQMIGQIPHEHLGLQNIRRLGADAREACELRTGLVLHPNTDEEAAAVDTSLPANNLVPVGDAEATQEALKFNTYALMLVCTIGARGFHVMASFDSRTIDKEVMSRVLKQFCNVAQQLASNTTATIGSIKTLGEDDLAAVQKAIASASQDPILQEYSGSTAAYLIRPSNPEHIIPHGAIGELVIQTTQPGPLQKLSAPSWLTPTHPFDNLYRTGKLAKYTTAGRIHILSHKTSLSKPEKAVPRKPKPTTLSTRQRKLRTLWARVLRLPETEIRLESDFFLLGGDSISAMKLASEARAEGIRLTVAQLFTHKTLSDLSEIMLYDETNSHTPIVTESTSVVPFALLDDIQDPAAFVEDIIRPQLEDTSSTIVDVLPTRFLQDIAVHGTVSKPRFSARYELITFPSAVDLPRLRSSCDALIALNEILRTVFAAHADKTYAAVLESLAAPFEWHTHPSSSSQTLSEFAKSICRADCEKPMPFGASFAKFLYVSDPTRPTSPSCLVFRLSHAQYDEMCLPMLLRQLSALYAHPSSDPEPSLPFSSYVHHLLRAAIPASIPYWTSLLAASAITTLRPAIPVTQPQHCSLRRSVDISPRSRAVTIASLPTAAWALCLARRLHLRDVTFGEVVSGRSVGFPGAEAVAGPCWQYVPVRVRMAEDWTGRDLLDYVQRQHVESAAHEGMSLEEMAALCAPGWERQKSMTGDGDERYWFDTVVHQDVSHVAARDNAASNASKAGEENTYETLYVHEEPLREWKIQAFVDEGGDGLTLEVVTFRSWGEYAKELLGELVGVMEELVSRPDEKLFG